MSVDTKGVIEIQDGSAKEMCEVLNCVRIACRDWVFNWFENEFPNASDSKRVQTFHTDGSQYKLPSFFDTTHFSCEVMSGRLAFTFGAEKRSLFICAYTTDHGAFTGKGMVLMLGCWGHSVEIMGHILSHVSENLELRTFIDENDCDDEGWCEINGKD